VFLDDARRELRHIGLVEIVGILEIRFLNIEEFPVPFDFVANVVAVELGPCFKARSFSIDALTASSRFCMRSASLGDVVEPEGAAFVWIAFSMPPTVSCSAISKSTNCWVTLDFADSAQQQG
jgi:hypothetical protein